MSAPHLGIDDEDFAWSIIPAIEKSFGIRFERNDFEKVETYGELCNVVQSKLTAVTVPTCTTQQAFYKLRLALQAHGTANNLKPNSLLNDALPNQWFQRRRAAQAIQKELDMKLDILKMPAAVEMCFTILLLLSLVGIPVAGLMVGSTGALVSAAGLVAAIVGLYAGNWLGTTSRYATVRELVIVMSSQFYRQSRRDPKSLNQSEIMSMLNELFSDYSGVDLLELTPDAVLM